MARILITNDDGIQAPGLRALVKAVEELGTVSVVAPASERSAAAQSLTLRQPIYCEKIAEREWAVEGTPADAVVVALHALALEKPDLILSGINRGGNLGENVYYSGTVGAAMEGAINRIPAIAISVAHKGSEFDFEPAATFMRRLAPLVLKEGLPPGVLLNVNVPQPWKGSVRFTHQSAKITRNLLKPGMDPRGRAYYWLYEQVVKNDADPESDYAAIFAGAVSITPLELDRTHPESLNHLSRWAPLLEEPGKV